MFFGVCRGWMVVVNIFFFERSFFLCVLNYSIYGGSGIRVFVKWILGIIGRSSGGRG